MQNPPANPQAPQTTASVPNKDTLLTFEGELIYFYF